MFPWLLRFLRAGTPGRALQASRALNAMHRNSFDNYRELVGSERFDDLFRLSGQIQLLKSGPETRASRTVRKIWEQNRVEVEEMEEYELHRLIPAISPDAKRALFFPRNGYTVSPRRLVETLLQCLLEAGGRFRQERVMRIVPEGAGRTRLVTNLDDAAFGKVVVSAGAWSRSLLAPLGVKPPLDTERGYHVMVHGASLDLRLPVLDRNRGFGATPLENGIRIAGTVELAGLDKPPDIRRADILLDHARHLFPSLRGEKYTMWMGFRPSTPDSLPIIDTVPGRPDISIACGHGHFGMTAASTTGLVVAQKIRGSKPAIDVAPYRLGRF
jgi:D-amino-acid dehydrogenase